MGRVSSQGFGELIRLCWPYLSPRLRTPVSQGQPGPASLGEDRLTQASYEERNEVPCPMLDEQHPMSNAHQGEQDAEHCCCCHRWVIVVIPELGEICSAHCVICSVVVDGPG
jgi:hypothetical protein